MGVSPGTLNWGSLYYGSYYLGCYIGVPYFRTPPKSWRASPNSSRAGLGFRFFRFRAWVCSGIGPRGGNFPFQVKLSFRVPYRVPFKVPFKARSGFRLGVLWFPGFDWGPSRCRWELGEDGRLSSFLNVMAFFGRLGVLLRLNNELDQSLLDQELLNPKP